MQSQTLGLRVSSVIFGFVCLAHLVRLIAGISMAIGSLYFNTPSTVIAIIVTGCLSIWLWKLSLNK